MTVRQLHKLSEERASPNNASAHIIYHIQLKTMYTVHFSFHVQFKKKKNVLLQNYNYTFYTTINFNFRLLIKSIIFMDFSLVKFTNRNWVQSILISLKPITVMRPTVLTRLLMDEVLTLIFEAFDFFASLYLTSMADISSFIPFWFTFNFKLRIYWNA